eukprot:7571266-Heterocapsa_arctica.AAC.1
MPARRSQAAARQAAAARGSVPTTMTLASRRSKTSRPPHLTMRLPRRLTMLLARCSAIPPLP